MSHHFTAHPHRQPSSSLSLYGCLIGSSLLLLTLVLFRFLLLLLTLFYSLLLPLLCNTPRYPSFASWRSCQPQYQSHYRRLRPPSYFCPLPPPVSLIPSTVPHSIAVLQSLPLHFIPSSFFVLDPDFPASEPILSPHLPLLFSATFGLAFTSS
jgi:hypothetical protein